MAGICLFSAFAFSACSDDDDENEGNGGSGNGSGISAAYFEADGKRTDYKYAYYWDDEYDVEINMATLDLRYYYSHPDQVTPDLTVSDIWVDFAPNVTSGDYYTYSTNEDKIVDIETDTWNLYKDVTDAEDDNSIAATYTADSSPSRCSTVKVTRTGNAWTIDAPSLLLTRSEGYDEYGRPTKRVQTNGKFYFKGSLVLMEGTYDEYEDNGTRVVKVEDPGFREWLKQRRKNRNK